jgi:SAD/SRA domain
MAKRVFGEIPGSNEGTYFESRAELSHAGVHRPLQAGISGSAYEGADSIVLSGGYEDDRDNGFEIIYTGHGGRDPETGEQVEDQELSKGNMALAYSMKNMLPVRVVRGAAHAGSFSPKAGYRYDGLYLVEDYWQEKGKSGYLVWRYRLVKQDKSSSPWLSATPAWAKLHKPKQARSKPGPKSITVKPAPTAGRSISKPLPSPAAKVGQPQGPSQPRFQVGDRVKHPTFGEGQILEVALSGQDQIVTVQFDGVGKTKLMANAAKLERV